MKIGKMENYHEKNPHNNNHHTFFSDGLPGYSKIDPDTYTTGVPLDI
jgi:hypothetical protein